MASATRSIETLLKELDVLTPLPSGGNLSAPKRIAALALYMQLACGLEADLALQASMAALADHLRTTRGGLKKAASEARAVMQFGLPARDFIPPTAESSAHLMQAITSALHGVNVREATQVRAQALGGVRGGRRHGPRVRPVLTAVQSLLELARAGEPDALAELADIEAMIRSATNVAHVEDRHEATRRS